MQDVFEILSYLSSLPDNRRASEATTFALFIHRRAFRKIGWRIEEFFTHWGESPFAILSKLDFSGMEPRLTEITTLSNSERKLLLSAGIPFTDVLPGQKKNNHAQSVPEQEPCVKIRVNSVNVKDWLNGFQKLFQLLRRIFPCYARRKMRPWPPFPDPAGVRVGVSIIRCFMVLKPVMRHVLSFPGVESVLSEAGG